MDFGALVRYYKSVCRASVSLAFGAFALAAYAEPAPGGGDDLVTVIERAKASNLAYAGSRAKTTADKEAVPIAISAMLPKIQVSAKSLLGSSQAGSDVGSGYNTNGYTVSLVQHIFSKQDWDAMDEAKLVSARATLDLAIAGRDLFEDCVGAYLEVLDAREKVLVADAHVAALQANQDAAEHTLKDGLGTVVDVEDARSRLQVAHADRVEALNAVTLADEKIYRLTNDDAVSVMQAVVSDTVAFDTQIPVDEIVSTARRNNLDILKAELDWHISQTRVDAATSEYYPSVNLVLNHSHGTESYIESETNIRASGRIGHSDSIGIQVVIPIYDGFGTNARRRQSMGEREAAFDHFSDVIRNNRYGIMQTYLRLSSETTRLASLKQAVASAVTTRNSMASAVTLGIRVRSDLLDAEDRLFREQNEVVNLKSSVLTDEVKLKGLSGTLSDQDAADIDVVLSGRKK